MKTTILILAAAALVACASQEEEQSRQDQVQAVRDFIEVRELEELDKLNSDSSDSYQSIENYFLIYEGRRDMYLVEFHHRCWELDDNTRIVADVRHDSNKIRARFDTIRGCRIQKIYALTEAEAVELENLGEAPGSRN